MKLIAKYLQLSIVSYGKKIDICHTSALHFSLRLKIETISYKHQQDVYIFLDL